MFLLVKLILLHVSLGDQSGSTCRGVQPQVWALSAPLLSGGLDGFEFLSDELSGVHPF
jgi:hypothetical protein